MGHEPDKNRPLPMGTLTIRQATNSAVLLVPIGLVLLYSINPRSAFFGGLSFFVIYFNIYSIKSKTSLAVFVGAFRSNSLHAGMGSG